MRDNDLIDHFRRHYDAPDADNEAVLQETERRFLQTPWEARKVFVDALETSMLDWEIGVRERAERVSLHRRFRDIHFDLKRIGR
jgi:hypothetical protein